jgi:hypothetical protein
MVMQMNIHARQVCQIHTVAYIGWVINKVGMHKKVWEDSRAVIRNNYDTNFFLFYKIGLIVIKINNIRKASFYSFIAVMGIVMILPTTSLIQVQAVTEDDGWIEDPNDGQTFEEEEEQAEKEWEDAGRPGDDDNSSNGNGNGNDDGPNPYCDLVPDNYQGACHDRLDYYESGPKSGLYPCNDGTDKADWRDCKDAPKKNNNNDDDNDNGNSVIPSLEASGLKDCGDGIVAVSCGVGRYWCSGGSGDSFHTNDYSDCEDATETKKETSPSSNNDNNFNPNNDNSNSNNLPECKRDVLQECKLSGNTGLLCGVEDLMQGDYNPNVIGDGHACHDVYIGTYNQLEACKDGTYAVSCGSIGVLLGIP